MAHKASILIEKGEHGYYAYSPELEGRQTQGDSFKEAVENAREAAALYLGTLTADEIKELLSKEIFSTTVELQVTWIASSLADRNCHSVPLDIRS